MAQNKIQSRDEKIEESMNSPIEIDLSIEMKFPISNYIKEDKKYKCHMCGKSWNAQKSHFSKSAHPKYQANNGYIEICNDCRDKYYKKLIDFYSGNEEHAIRHMCMEFGWVYHLDALIASRQISADRSRIGHYLAKKNLGQTTQIGTTYFDSMKFEYENKEDTIVENISDVKDKAKAKLKTVKFFGTGFTDDDYLYLQEQYDDWTTRHECKTKAQEEVFKRICFKQLEILKATRKGESTKDLDHTYQQLLDTANLKPRQNTNALSDAQTLGTLIQKWENTRPIPEIDEELKDVDKIGLYIDVFFKGHLAKMMGLKNGLSNLYSKFMKKYTVEKPEYKGDENNEALFDAIFGSDEGMSDF